MSDLFAELREGDITAGRHRGNARSADANRAVAVRKPTQREQIVSYLRDRADGATCEEIAAALGMRYTSISARLAELKALHQVRPNGRQRATTAGEKADVLILSMEHEGNHPGA